MNCTGASAGMANVQRALELARSGDIGGAQRECLGVLAEVPNEVAALNLLAELHVLSKQPAAAMECLERITRLTPKDAAAHRRLGNARFEAQATREAIL